MVKIKKVLTHIYHGSVRSPVIAIGNSENTGKLQTELFKKSLALTADLKRLPFLLGGKLYFWIDAHALYNVGTATLTGIGITAVLMNGTYDGAEFGNYTGLIADQNAMDDVLLVAHGNLNYVPGVAEYNLAVNFTESHWDFEGQVVLYDTISLVVFLDADTNVAVADYLVGKLRANYEIEIDWAPISLAELQEFLLEHIYAKQGD